MSWWNGASGGRESERTWFDLPALSRSTQRQDVNPTYAEGLIRYQARGRPAHSWRRSPDAPDLDLGEVWNNIIHRILKSAWKEIVLRHRMRGMLEAQHNEWENDHANVCRAYQVHRSGNP